MDKLKQYIHVGLDLRGLLLVALVSSWLVGITVNAWLLLSPLTLLLAGMLALPLILLGWRQPLLRLSGLVLLCLSLGAWRYTSVSPVGDAHVVRAFIDLPC